MANYIVVKRDSCNYAVVRTIESTEKVLSFWWSFNGDSQVYRSYPSFISNGHYVNKVKSFIGYRNDTHYWYTVHILFCNNNQYWKFNGDSAAYPIPAKMKDWDAKRMLKEVSCFEKIMKVSREYGDPI